MRCDLRLRENAKDLELPDHADDQADDCGFGGERRGLAAVDRFEANAAGFAVVAFDEGMTFGIDCQDQIAIAAIGLAADNQVVSFGDGIFLQAMPDDSQAAMSG